MALAYDQAYSDDDEDYADAPAAPDNTYKRDDIPLPPLPLSSDDLDYAPDVKLPRQYVGPVVKPDDDWEPYQSQQPDDGYITDPDLLKQLGPPTRQPDDGYITDPDLLRQLGSPSPPTRQADDGYVTDPDLLKQLGTPGQPAPEPEGALGSFVREAVHGAPPAVAGAVTGMATAGAAGTFFGPVGTFVAGMGGGIVGGITADVAQDKLLKASGYDDDLLRAANRQAHPWASAAGSGVSSLAGFGAGVKKGAVTLGQRLFSGGISGGIETGQQAYQGTPLSEAVPSVAASTVAGLVAAHPYQWGRNLESAGERLGVKLGGTARPKPGTPPPDPTTSRSAMPDTGGVAKEAVPPTAVPAQAGTGSTARAPAEVPRVNTSDLDPAIAAALDPAGRTSAPPVGTRDPAVDAAIDAHNRGPRGGGEPHAESTPEIDAAVGRMLGERNVGPTEPAPVEPSGRPRVRLATDDSGQRSWNVERDGTVLSRHETADQAYRAAAQEAREPVQQAAAPTSRMPPEPRAAATARPDAGVLRGPMPAAAPQRGPLAREVAPQHMPWYDRGYEGKPRGGNEAEQAAWDRGANDRMNADRAAVPGSLGAAGTRPGEVQAALGKFRVRKTADAEGRQVWGVVAPDGTTISQHTNPDSALKAANARARATPPAVPAHDKNAFIAALVKGPEAVAAFARGRGMTDAQARSAIYEHGDSNATSQQRYQRYLDAKATRARSPAPPPPAAKAPAVPRVTAGVPQYHAPDGRVWRANEKGEREWLITTKDGTYDWRLGGKVGPDETYAQFADKAAAQAAVKAAPAAQRRAAPEPAPASPIEALAQKHGVTIDTLPISAFQKLVVSPGKQGALGMLEVKGPYHKDGVVHMPAIPEAEFQSRYGASKETVLAHEVAHALLTKWGMTGEIKGSGYEGLRAELRAVSRQYRASAWKNAPQHVVKSQELMSDALAAWMSRPELRAGMPLFKELLGTRLDDRVAASAPAGQAPPGSPPSGQLPLPPPTQGLPGGARGAPPPAGPTPPRGGLPPSGPPPGGPPRSPPPPGASPPPPSPSSAQAAILNRIAKPESWSRIPGVADLKTSWQRLYTAVKDDLDPLQRFTKTLAQGRTLAAEADPYKLARLTRGSWGRTEQMLTHGTFDFDTGKNNGPSLQKVLEPVANDLDGFTAYATAKRAIELEGRGIKTGMPMPEAHTVVVQGAKLYEPVFRELVAFQGRVLDYLQKSGIVSHDAVAKMRAKNAEFVPYYRLVDPGKELGAAAGLKVRDPIFRIEGSEREVLNPIDSIIRNSHTFVTLAERNRTLQALADLAKSHPQGDLLMRPVARSSHPIEVTEPELQKWMDETGIKGIADDTLTIFRPNAFQPKPDEIRLYVNGKPKIYKVEAPVAEAVNNMDRATFDTLTRIISAPARWLRAGATLAPEFIVRNPVRDQFSALAFSKYGYLPVYDLVRGLGHLLKKDDVFQSWLKSGGANATLVALDRKTIGMSPKDFTGRLTGVIRSPIELLRAASELMENATRLGEFNRAVKQGASPFEAAFSSREVTLDFARIGANAKIKAFNAIVPFFNAQVEGVDRAARAFRDNPVGTLTKVGLSITLPSVLLWFANKDDERYQELPQWQKDLFWIVPTDNWLPMTAAERARFPEDLSKLKNTIRQAQDGSWQRNAGTLWKIPKPFELGVLFGSVPERALDAYFKHNPNAFKNLHKTVLQALTPSWLPQIAVPPFEQWANRSFFLDRSLLTPRQERLPPAQQVGPFTSETAKVAGNVIRSVIGDKSSFGSPIIIDNYIKDWTGGLGQYVVNGIDWALKSGKDLPPEPAWSNADVPGLKAFVARFPASNAQSIQDFYDERNARKMEQAGIKDQLKSDPKGAVERLKRSDSYTGDPFAKALQADRDAVNRIMADRKLSPSEKRSALDLALLIMIQHAKKGLEVFEIRRKAVAKARAQPALVQ